MLRIRWRGGAVVRWREICFEYKWFDHVYCI